MDRLLPGIVLFSFAMQIGAPDSIASTWREELLLVSRSMKPRRPGLRSLLGDCHRRALNCPQRAQRCFLHLGHPPEPCDNEPFIGPVASQRPHQLGALDVPHLDGTILPATDQQTAIGANFERMDSSLMSLAHRQTLPTLCLPPAQGPIALSTHQQVSARIPCYGINTIRQSLKDTHQLPVVRLPQKQLSFASSDAPTGEPGAVRTPGHARDICTVPSVARHRRTVPSSPQLARRLPSGLHATRRTQVGCARPTQRRLRVVISQTCTPCI